MRRWFNINKKQLVKLVFTDLSLEELSEQFAKINFDSAANELDETKEKLTNFKYYILSQIVLERKDMLGVKVIYQRKYS